ncbi:hypothetical protein V6N13_032064 [Hibiscus sabdariffa]
MLVDHQPGTEPKGPHRLGLLLVPWQLWCRHGSHQGAGMVGWQPQGAVIGRGGQWCRHAGIRTMGGCFTGLGHLEPSTILGHLGST